MLPVWPHDGHEYSIESVDLDLPHRTEPDGKTPTPFPHDGQEMRAE